MHYAGRIHLKSGLTQFSISMVIVALLLLPSLTQIYQSRDTVIVLRDLGQGIEPSPSSPSLTKVTFPSSSFVLPMDARQPNMTQAFGFVHAMLRNGSYIYRIICPPGVLLKTNATPAGIWFGGGPVLFLPPVAPVISAVLPSFPSVIIYTLSAGTVSDKVFIVKEPTKILWLNGGAGGTYKLLQEMKIPFTTCYDKDIKAYPDMVWKYTLLIDDCTGMGGVMEPVARVLRNFTARGNEIIFTCWALTDLKHTFPGYVTGTILTSATSRSTSVKEAPDFPAQYNGTVGMTLKGIWTQAQPGFSNVTSIARGSTWHDAMYFYFGTGVAEFFSFHPGEQSGDARRAATILYGNKLIHATPVGDTSVSASASASPVHIARNGTSDPISERCCLNITLRPLGFNVTPASALWLNYRLLPAFVNENGSFRDIHGLPLSPDGYRINPDGSRDLRWNITTLKGGSDWTLKFNITSYVSGNGLDINDPLASNITYVDGDGIPRIGYLSPLSVDVSDGYVIGEIPTLYLVAFSFLMAIPIMFLSHKIAKNSRMKKHR